MSDTVRVTAMVRRLCAACCTVAAIATVYGCTTIKTGVVGEVHENVRPFAEQTISALALRRIDFRESEFAYLRAISDLDAPEVERLREMLAIADKFRDEIVYYSVELVRVVEMNATEEERIQAYADVLDAMRQTFPVRLERDDSARAAIDADIRSQQTLLAALGAAQPLFDSAGRQFEDVLREIEDSALGSAVTHLDNLIENHYAVFVKSDAVMVQRRDEMLTALVLVRDVRLGNTAAVDELRALPIVVNRGLIIPGSPSSAQLSEVESFILAEMDRDNAVLEYIKVDIDAYLKAHAELEREEQEVIDGLNIARLQVVAWSRAHQAMANGSREPGKWLQAATDAVSALRSTRIVCD